MKLTKISLLLMVLLYLVSLGAVTEAETAIQAQADSLQQIREQQIQSEFAFTERSTLSEVAGLLKVDINTLKANLNLENDNPKLDNQSLSMLGVSAHAVLMAKQSMEYGYNELSTLQQVATMYSLPIKKLKHLLRLDPLDKSINTRSLQALNVAPGQIEAARKEFDKGILGMSVNITIVGMLVVFGALLLTNIIILQMRHLNREEKSSNKTAKIKVNSSGTVTSASSNMTSGDIIAAITALHIYTQAIEERRRITLTFKRNEVSHWRAAGLNEMPNRLFNRNR